MGPTALLLPKGGVLQIFIALKKSISLARFEPPTFE
jgi:hypothetical protein